MVLYFSFFLELNTCIRIFLSYFLPAEVKWAFKHLEPSTVFGRFGWSLEQLISQVCQRLRCFAVIWDRTIVSPSLNNNNSKTRWITVRLLGSCFIQQVTTPHMCVVALQMQSTNAQLLPFSGWQQAGGSSHRCKPLLSFSSPLPPSSSPLSHRTGSTYSAAPGGREWGGGERVLWRRGEKREGAEEKKDRQGIMRERDESSEGIWSLYSPS